jgi:uroporphyrinogen decarboxylase
MTGKERVLNAIELKETDHTPWVPFVGVHGGYLTGHSADEYLNDRQLIIDGVSKAIEQYDPDGIPVLFDLQIEAEVLGCELKWSSENPPAVVSHPLSGDKKLEDLKIPEVTDGRIKVALEASRKLREMYPDIALYGLITGPFTLAMHLLGTDLFMKLFEDPESIHQLMDFCKDVGEAMAEYYIDTGCDVIAVVDPMTSQIDPDTFENFVKPYVRSIFDYVREKGAKSSFFVCGHAQQNIEVMCKCKPDNISIDENIPLDYVKDLALNHNVSFGGNLQLTVVLLMGDPVDCQKNALECMDIGANKGFILAPGCDLPMKTPVENIRAVSEMVRDAYQQEVVRTMEKKSSELELLNMKDYGSREKVIVDVITLDSESCAPCQYMVEAVKKIAPHFEGLVEWREHAIKKMEGVSFMSSLMVRNIPTICIDGKVAFVSQIPSQSKLVEAIQSRINEKLKLKIHSRKGEITVLCRENDDCDEILRELDFARQELGTDVSVNCVSNEDLIASYGISKTPAIITTKYSVKSQGTVPSKDVLKEWMKSLEG